MIGVKFPKLIVLLLIYFSGQKNTNSFISTFNAISFGMKHRIDDFFVS